MFKLCTYAAYFVLAVFALAIMQPGESPRVILGQADKATAKVAPVPEKVTPAPEKKVSLAGETTWRWCTPEEAAQLKVGKLPPLTPAPAQKEPLKNTANLDGHRIKLFWNAITGG